MLAASESIFETIGATPTVRLSRIVPAGGAEVLLKLEHLSPNGALHDRVAFALVERAEQAGRLAPGGTVVEASAGSTAIGLAMLCAERGYRLMVTMPEHMSLERRQALASWGAKVELTPAARGMAGARARALELAEQTPGGLFLDQFGDPAVVELHAETTGAELVETVRADGGRIDAFVTGVGTGAALTGIGRALKAAFPRVRVVAVEPRTGSALAKEAVRPHRLQGIGMDFPPPLLDGSILDAVARVDEREAWEMRARLGREEGLLVGVSTGASVVAALGLSRELGAGGRVYSLACDTGERYFSLAEQFA